MTEISFSRFFKSRTGRTFIDTVNDIRLGQASRMLIDTTHCITEVGYKCGFNNISWRITPMPSSASRPACSTTTRRGSETWFWRAGYLGRTKQPCDGRRRLHFDNLVQISHARAQALGREPAGNAAAPVWFTAYGRRK